MTTNATMGNGDTSSCTTNWTATRTPSEPSNPAKSQTEKALAPNEIQATSKRTSAGPTTEPLVHSQPRRTAARTPRPSSSAAGAAKAVRITPTIATANGTARSANTCQDGQRPANDVRRTTGVASRPSKPTTTNTGAARTAATPASSHANKMTMTVGRRRTDAPADRASDVGRPWVTPSATKAVTLAQTAAPKNRTTNIGRTASPSIATRLVRSGSSLIRSTTRWPIAWAYGRIASIVTINVTTSAAAAGTMTRTAVLAKHLIDLASEFIGWTAFRSHEIVQLDARPIPSAVCHFSDVKPTWL
jgi:hypothetical protein